MNEHRQNSSQRNYLSKNFIRKPIILSLKEGLNGGVANTVHG